jgi:cell division protease FtsH
MVMRFGMSQALGPRVFGHEHSQPFLGREFSSEPDYSDRVAEQIDEEVRRVVEEAHTLATEVLTEYRTELDRVSEILLSQETIDREEFLRLLDGEEEEAVFPVRKESVDSSDAAAQEDAPGAVSTKEDTASLDAHAQQAKTGEDQQSPDS